MFPQLKSDGAGICLHDVVKCMLSDYNVQFVTIKGILELRYYARAQSMNTCNQCINTAG